jgi:hydrogenase maturation protease
VTKTNLLVLLAVGNEIRKDDAAGIRVVKNLEQDSTLKHMNISFKYLNTGGFDILDEIDGFRNAIIVDAADMADKGYKPGEILHIKNLNELDVDFKQGVSSHGIGILPILKYAEESSYNLPKKIEIFGIQVKDTNVFSEELTPEVKQGVEKLTTHLKEYILNLLD